MKIKFSIGNLFIVIAVLIILISGIYFYKTQIMNIEKNSENKFLSAINNALLSSNEEEISVTGETEDTEQTTSTISTENWDLTKVNIVYDTEGVPVPVPKGYVASGVDGEHTVNTGFVIYEGEGEVTTENAWDESVSRNQWVWVPVYDSSRIYKVDENGRKTARCYWYSSTQRSESTSCKEPDVLVHYDNEKEFARCNSTVMAKEKLYQELQEEYNQTIESIEKYGGFYIGRYETGNLSNRIPVVKRMNLNISNETWYGMYSKLKYLRVNNNVKTNIIWGSLWDETVQWFIDSGSKIYEEIGADSTSYGNYINSEFEYICNGSLKKKSAGGAFGQMIPTGSTEYTKVNNIYDMAGNVMERTLETDSSGVRRRTRGGAYDNYYSVPFKSIGVRYDSSPLTVSSLQTQVGVRAFLYIK